MAYVRLSVGVGGALDMFEFELFIRARFRTDNLTYAIHSANETIYGQHPGITGTSPLTPTHTLYNLQPRQYAPNIMYT
jgi:hypothetical protein